MLYIVYLIILIGLVYLYLKQVSKELYFPFLLGLVCKIGGGITLGLLYQYYYNSTGDTFFFHNESIKLKKIIGDDVWKIFSVLLNDSYSGQNPRAFFFIKILALLNFATGSNYWINGALCSIFSFIGAWSLAMYLHKRYGVSIWVGLASLVLVPSTLLWSSGLLKESLAFGSLCLLIKYTCQFSDKSSFSIKTILLALAVLLLLVNLRYFYAAVFVPVAFSFVVTKRLGANLSLNKAIICFTFLVVGSLFLATLLHPNLSLDYISTVLLQNYNDVKRISDASGSYDLLIGRTLFGNLFIIPQAMFTGLFRPLPWDVNFGIKILAAVENILTLLAAIISFLILVRQRIFSLEFLAILTYAFLLSMLIAIASPNWGSLLRYRIGYQPFLILLITYVISRKYFEKQEG